MTTSAGFANTRDKWDRRKAAVRDVLKHHPNGLSSYVIADKVSNRSWTPSPGTITSVCKRLGCLWERSSPNAPTTWRLPRPTDGDVKVKYVSVMPGWSGGLLDPEEVKLLTEYFMDKSLSYDCKSKFVDQVVGLFALAVPDQVPPPQELLDDLPISRIAVPESRTTWQWVVHIMKDRIFALAIGELFTTADIANIVHHQCPDVDRKHILMDIRAVVEILQEHDFLEFSRGGQAGTKIKRVSLGAVRL